MEHLSLYVALVCVTGGAVGLQEIVSTSCGHPFCEKSKDYPLSKDDQRFLANDTQLEFLRSPASNKTSNGMNEDDPDLPPTDLQQQICPSDVTVIFPQEAVNIRGQRRFIINFPPFMQGLSVERCLPNVVRLPCSFVGVPPGFQSVCVQKEVEHRLTTIESDPGTGLVQTGVDIFRFPSFCACKLVRADRPLWAPPCLSPPQTGPVYGLLGADEGTTPKKISVEVHRKPADKNSAPPLSSRTEGLFGDAAPPVVSSGARGLKWKGFLV